MSTAHEISKTMTPFYNSFLTNRHRLVRPFLFGILLLALVMGGSYRIADIKENFRVTNGFEFFVNMASHFWTSPGGYNFEDGLKMRERPDDYVFSRHPKESATGSFENEKGWAFILSLIFKEGTKGIQNLAVTVVRYQLMLDLFVIVLLFWAGRSIAGPLGGGLSAVLYALFRPSISMTSWVVYYYWSIPFSAISLLFWTTIYKPEEREYSLRFSSLLFFLYGMAMGFATSLRLSFLFLPLFLSPLIFFQERVLKRALVLLLAMLIGQGVLLVPQAVLTYKWYDKPTLTTRGIWHTAISGLGTYPNPFGIRDSGDLTAVNWAISRGGPDLNKVGIQEYDRFMKKEAIRLFKERPDIFLRNFKTNLYCGITMSCVPGGPFFSGIMVGDKGAFSPEADRLGYLFPWFVLFGGFILFFFHRERLGPLMAVVFQGLYVLGILCVYFPPAYQHTDAYFPVFTLLLGVAVAVLVRGIISIPEGFLRCWLGNKEGRYWPTMAKECFREDWDKEYNPAEIGQAPSVIGQRRHPVLKWLFVFSGIVILSAGLFIARVEKNIPNERPDDRTVQALNNILNPETNGGFELWNSGEPSLPDGWGFNDARTVIHKATGIEEVRMGASSVEVHASSSWNAGLYFSIPNDELYYLIGKTITVTGWVKSDNKSANKIYISLRGGLGPWRDPIAYYVYYQNIGEWERLVLTYKVPEDILCMSIVLGVDRDTDAPVYFDGIEMSYVPRYTD